MNGIVTSFNAVSGIAKVDLAESDQRVTYDVSLKGTPARHMPLLVGQSIRFHDTGRGTGSFLGLGISSSSAVGDDEHNSDVSAITFTGVVSKTGHRFHSLSVPVLGVCVCCPSDIVPSSCASTLGVGTVVDFVLRRGTIMVDAIVAIRQAGSDQDVATRLDEDESKHGSTFAMRHAATKLNKHPNSAPGVPGANDVYADVIVKKELITEYCADATVQQFASRSGCQLGTWTVSGFDPSFFFPPELNIRFLHGKMELVNNTPPLVCQGDVVEVQLWSFWTLEGTSMDLRIVDESGVDVTMHVASVSILVPDNIDATTMDGLMPQQVCTFEVTLLPFHMDETCEIYFEVSARKSGLLLPAPFRGENGVTLMPCDPGSISQKELSCVCSTVTSRPIFVRSAAVAKGERSLDENSLSHTFWVRNVLGPNEHVVSGFIDPGRSNTLVDDTELYESLNLINSEREVLVIDRDDLKLKSIVDGAYYIVDKIADTHAKAAALLWYVDSVFSAQRSNLFTSTSTSAAVPPPVARPTVPNAVASKRGGLCGRASLRSGVDSRKRCRPLEEPRPTVMRLGDVSEGLCRHRSLLYKYLCDTVRVPCYLVRGEHQGPDDKVAERHSWNIVVVGARHVMMVADSTMSPHRLLSWPNTAYRGPQLPPPEVTNHFQMLMLSGGGHRPHIQEECGRGASASVRRCVVGGLTCVVKIPRHEADISILRNEFDILSGFGHFPHVVRTFGWYKGIILEHFPLSLLALMNMLLLRRSRLGEGQIRQVLVAVVTALRHVHDAHYVHRDIKAENVLVNVQRCRSCLQFGTVCKECTLAQVALADFADCYSLGHHKDFICEGAPPVGTAPYAAPEIEHERSFSFAADIWSVGILASEMLLMQLPNETCCPSGRSCTVVALNGSEHTVFVPSASGSDPPWAQRLISAACRVDWRDRKSARSLLEMIESSKTSPVAVPPAATTTTTTSAAATTASAAKQPSKKKR